MVKTQQGYLVLADISGYTSYVATTELEHANEVLSDLLELIVTHLTPTLELAKLEGDAVFVYTPKSRLPNGETLLELIEATYMAFRDRVRSIQQRTTCECNACRAIPSLDLKFLAHSGAYIVQSVGGIKELLGSDVNLIHRLAKNRVTESTGWRAYALFTEPCLQEIGVQPEGMYAYAESYEHLGAINIYCLNLRERYKVLNEARRIYISPEEADGYVTVEMPAPPAIVWGWVNDMTKLTLVSGGNVWQPLSRPGGRRGIGARNHCAHGKNVHVRSTILDWKPFDYFTEEAHLAMPPIKITATSIFEPTAGGARLMKCFKLPANLPRWVRRLICKMFLPPNKQWMEEMAQLIARTNQAVDEASPAPAVLV